MQTEPAAVLSADEVIRLGVTLRLDPDAPKLPQGYRISAPSRDQIIAESLTLISQLVFALAEARGENPQLLWQRVCLGISQNEGSL